MQTKIIIHGEGKRHQVILENGMYSLVDTKTGHARASLSEGAWNIDAKAVFIRFCDKWNEGVYRDGLS